MGSCLQHAVILPDGTNVTRTLVKDGWCWWYRKYAPLNTELEQLEKSAQEAKKGLWAEPNPMPPWEWGKSRVLPGLKYIHFLRSSPLRLPSPPS